MTKHHKKDGIIKYGDQIQLQHVRTKKYLGTNGNHYEFGSKQQCVFTSQSPSTWVVVAPEGSGEEDGYEVGWDDKVLLKPKDFPDLRLHSLADTMSPVSGQQEVSCYDGSDHNSAWKVVQFDEDGDDDVNIFSLKKRHINVS
ncbi:unnamed protein product [Absidia cylindrospora]